MAGSYAIRYQSNCSTPDRTVVHVQCTCSVGCMDPSLHSGSTAGSRGVGQLLDTSNKVEQQIFACRKFSRISRFSADSRIFLAREYYYYTVLASSFQQLFKAKNPLYPEIREIFLLRTCLAYEFAKLTCREIFLFYSIVHPMYSRTHSLWDLNVIGVYTTNWTHSFHAILKSETFKLSNDPA